MFVNDRVRVLKLERDAPGEDRSSYVEQDGVLTQRLNVPWDPGTGALWRVRFADRSEAIFSEAELSVLDAAGQPVGTEIDELRQTWGDAPRAGSMPFKRRATGTGQAVLAFIVLSLAGLLLIGAGVAQSDLRISAGGGALILVALGAAALMVG